MGIPSVCQIHKKEDSFRDIINSGFTDIGLFFPGALAPK